MKKRKNKNSRVQAENDKFEIKLLNNNKDEEDEDKNSQKLARKKMPSFGKACTVLLVIILVSIVLARYVTDEGFRNYVDTKIIKKEVSSDDLKYIDIDSENNPNVYAFDKYITVLSKSQLKMYTGNGKQEASLEVNIASPVMDADGKYLIIGEKNGSKLFLVCGTNVVWQTTVEGEISRVSVNKNGYVSIIVKNTTYKSVIITFNTDGREIFKYYLSSTYAICSDISADNKYLAIGDVDYSGTIVKSNIKILSMQLATTSPTEAIVHKYESDADEIVTNIDYSNKEYAVCMFNSYIQKVSETSEEKVLEFGNDTIFCDITLKDNIGLVEKQSSGSFSYDYQLRIKSTISKAESLYILNNSMPKSIICYGNNIGINFGNEIQLVRANGWLIKKYTSEKEIKSLVLGSKIAGIVYKDKIEIINF